MASAEKKKTISKKKKKLQNISVSTKLPQPKLRYPLSSKKPSRKIRTNPSAGVIKTEQEWKKYHKGVYAQFSPEEIATHTPQYNVVPYSRGSNPKPLSAAQITQRRSKSKTFFPKFFMNPYQDLDYMVLQDIYANSIDGRIIDRKES